MAKVLVEISARHVHVTREALDVLYGKGYELTPKKDLSQPGQFACEERVAVVGTKGRFHAVSILGPLRNACQVELSASDARAVGIAALVRESGDIKGSGVCKLVGPEGEYMMTEGVIIAKRHIHLTPEAAAEFGVTDQQTVSVKLDTENRSLIFGDVVIRVSDKFSPAMHVDTDEGNAASAVTGMMGEIIS